MHETKIARPSSSKGTAHDPYSPRNWVAATCVLLISHGLVLGILGTTSPGPFLSNLIQLGIGFLCVPASIQASRRSGPLGHYFWRLMAFTFPVWILAQLLATFHEFLPDLGLGFGERCPVCRVYGPAGNGAISRSRSRAESFRPSAHLRFHPGDSLLDHDLSRFPGITPAGDPNRGFLAARHGVRCRVHRRVHASDRRDKLDGGSRPVWEDGAFPGACERSRHVRQLPRTSSAHGRMVRHRLEHSSSHPPVHCGHLEQGRTIGATSLRPGAPFPQYRRSTDVPPVVSNPHCPVLDPALSEPPDVGRGDCAGLVPLFRRAPPGHAASSATQRDVAAQGQGSRGAGQPRQERVSRQHEPRNSDADERRARHDRTRPRHRHQPKTTRIPIRPGQVLGGFAAHAHQRHPGLLQNRGRKAQPLPVRLQPEKSGGRYRPELRFTGAPEGPRTKLPASRPTFRKSSRATRVVCSR